MNCTQYFGTAKLINLSHRVDRLIDSSIILNEYGILFERKEAIYNKEAPCIGLVDTMKEIFKEALDNNHDRVLIFEDDIKPMVSPEFFQSTMECAINELPADWDMLYLGCNPAGGFDHWVSNTLLRLRFGYNTHAVAYGRRTMEFILNRNIKEPVDNYLVREYQKTATILATYPILFSQEPGFSDIGGQHTDWTKEIQERYWEQVKLTSK